MQITQSTSCKVCFKCGVEKPLTEFYKHKDMADGHLNKCKDCTRRDVKEHRDENAERYREYDRSRQSVDRHTDRKGYRKRNPLKYRAHCAVNNAVRDGKISKPSSCEGCGKSGRIHGHHHSYERDSWLKVRWLCSLCHMQEHVRLRRLGIDPDT